MLIMLIKSLYSTNLDKYLFRHSRPRHRLEASSRKVAVHRGNTVRHRPEPLRQHSEESVASVVATRTRSWAHPNPSRTLPHRSRCSSDNQVCWDRGDTRAERNRLVRLREPTWLWRCRWACDRLDCTPGVLECKRPVRGPPMAGTFRARLWCCGRQDRPNTVRLRSGRTRSVTYRRSMSRCRGWPRNGDRPSRCNGLPLELEKSNHINWLSWINWVKIKIKCACVSSDEWTAANELVGRVVKVCGGCVSSLVPNGEISRVCVG